MIKNFLENFGVMDYVILERIVEVFDLCVFDDWMGKI